MDRSHKNFAGRKFRRRGTGDRAGTALLACIILSGCALGREDGRTIRDPVEPQLTAQVSGTNELLIGLHALNDEVAWAAGTHGIVLRTVDGGATWNRIEIPGADSLQFRDVHAVSRDFAYALSIGLGSESRIYKTTDGGDTWTEQFRNADPDAFYDCFDFWSDGAGLAFSDAVKGRFPMAETRQGEAWTISERSHTVAALPGEGGFAASGTCLVTLGDDAALIGTGNAAVARVLRTENRGQSWAASQTPLVSGEGAGITTLAFRDMRHGAALGGDLARPDAVTPNVAVTSDGGATWQLGKSPTFAGPVYGSSYVPDTNILVAVGPGGASYSYDDAASWHPLDSLSYWSVDVSAARVGWAVGPDGRITKIRF